MNTAGGSGSQTNGGKSWRKKLRSFLQKFSVSSELDPTEERNSSLGLSLSSEIARIYQSKVEANISPKLSSHLRKLPVPSWARLSFCFDFSDLATVQQELSLVPLRAVSNLESKWMFIGLETDSDEVIQRDGVLFEVWQKSPGGDLLPSSGNHWISSFDSIPSPLELSPNERTSLENESNPIDAVYLWVDGSDPLWRQRLRDSTGASIGMGGHSLDRSRFESFDELEHSMRSLRKNAPWIRTIYVVTDSQDPRKKFELPWIRVVDHSEIIPKEFLPTFNSNVISLYLKNIDGLSNQFLYLNDDVFLARETEPNYFFDSNGICKVRLTRTSLPSLNAEDAHVLHLARANTIRIAHSRGFATTSRSLYHGPHALRIDILEDIFSMFQAELAQASRNKIRAGNDIVIEWLHFFVAHSLGLATYENASDYMYVNINSRLEHQALAKQLTKKLPRFLTLNQAAEIEIQGRATEIEIQDMLRLVWQKLEVRN